MAVSPTPRPTPVRAAPLVNPALEPLRALKPQAPATIAIAFSGGADSTALLLAATNLWPQAVQAIHVNHGLQPAAGAFVGHCQTVCDRLRVRLQVVVVHAGHERGESPEDAARKARYRALAQGAAALGANSVLLAQHADDQVETLLLALSRGSGLPGLASMPATFERHGMLFLRPLLAVSTHSIRRWLAQERIAYAQDPTNADTAFTRNRIRHELLPALEKTFPQFRETFARSARHAAQGQELLVALAEQDLVNIGCVGAVNEVGSTGEIAEGLSIKELQKLPRARQANALRHWLGRAHGAVASTAQLGELLDQVEACSTRGHGIRIKVGDGLVTRSGARLAYSAPI